MNKEVYIIIGHIAPTAGILAHIHAFEEENNVTVVVVKSIGDIPDTIKQEHILALREKEQQEQLTMTAQMLEEPVRIAEGTKRYKGYERPYKYHK